MIYANKMNRQVRIEEHEIQEYKDLGYEIVKLKETKTKKTKGKGK